MADAIVTNRAHAADVTDLAGRHKISQTLLNLVKFAVSSAVHGSRKIIPGKKHADKMVQEGLINIPFSIPFKTKNKPDIKVANDIHFQTKLDGVDEDINAIKQQNKTSSKPVEGSLSPNKSDDGFKEIGLLKRNGRRVFIRSRL